LFVFLFLGASFINWNPKATATQSSEVIQPEPPILSDDKKREMLEKEKVWISDPHDGFVLGRIVDLTEEGALVERVHGKRCETTVSFEQLYPCEEDEQKDVDDNCGLMYLNQVDNLRD
jgi:hypothetical protein